jgi:transposase
MPEPLPTDPKAQSLRTQGALNPHPGTVRDELFVESEFFDPRDLVQVKYEMLRRAQKDGLSVTQAARVFGFSRPTFYQAQGAFQSGGLAALVPLKRGPRHPHKLTSEVLDFIRDALQGDPALRATELAGRIQERFGLTIHPRTVERGVARTQKKR